MLSLEKSEGLNKMLDDKIISKFNIEKTSITKIKGDASGREYFRVNANGDLKILCKDPDLKDHSNMFLQTQRALKDQQFLVPEIYEIDLDTQSFLQEDLGDVSFLVHVESKNEAQQKEAYVKALEIAKSFLEFPSEKYSSLASTQLKFDKEKYLFEQEMTFKFFIERYLNISDPKEKTIVESFYKRMTEKLLKMKTAMVHRDFHSRNLMIKNEKIYVIDFQDMRLGPYLYDVVSLLEDCYFSIEEELKNELKNHAKSFLNIENFELEYQVVKAQRLLKALGTFTNQYYEKNKNDYLPYIASTIENLKSVPLSFVESKDAIALILSKSKEHIPINT
jgi:aminoglycoside/choline kinase family phosphotransferase